MSKQNFDWINDKKVIGVTSFGPGIKLHMSDVPECTSDVPGCTSDVPGCTSDVPRMYFGRTLEKLIEIWLTYR
jgi:hypothetical protein